MPVRFQVVNTVLWIAIIADRPTVGSRQEDDLFVVCVSLVLKDRCPSLMNRPHLVEVGRAEPSGVVVVGRSIDLRHERHESPPLEGVACV